jgi:alcohol dehydrogenase (cytochrome c)
MRFLLALLGVTSVYAQDGAAGANWPHHGGSQFAWRYSALNQIDTSNVKSLAVAWAFQTGDYGDSLQSTPIVIDGVMYVSTSYAQVFALDAATGRLIWRYKYPLSANVGRSGGEAFRINRGLAVSGGKVFLGTPDSFLVAIDQKTGRELWSVNVDDSNQCGCSITSAPLVVKDKVIVGGSGGDNAHRGYLTAFYAKTGRLAWRWYVIPGPGEKGHESWKGDSWKTGGGSPWLTGSFDAELNLLYWGTGNAAGDFYAGDRNASESKDVNLYTASVVALDPDTGKLRWHFQEIPNDVWDFDSSYECILMNREVQGRMRKLLVHMNKSVGVFSVPEVQTWISGVTEDGKLVGRREPELGKTINFCPTPAGAKSWNEMAYSPRTGLIYTPTLEICVDITAEHQAADEGRFFMSGSWDLKLPPNRATYSHVDAWDPVTGKRAWSYPYKYVLLASMLATAGDLVFTGNPEGDFFALDARTGAKLWSFQTGAGHRGSAVSYAVNGKQYIATPTGWPVTNIGAATQALFPEQVWRNGSTMMVFALPGGSR